MYSITIFSMEQAAEIFLTGMDGIHFNREMDEYYMREAQKDYEQHYGSREDFIRECGKSYL